MAVESRGITGAGNGAREMGTYTSTSLNVIKSHFLFFGVWHIGKKLLDCSDSGFLAVNVEKK
jgi:hypothetical protein